MITEKVFSIFEDKKIRNNISESPIWKQCYKEEEVTNELIDRYNGIYIYTIKFNGLIPKQVTKIKKIRSL